MKKLISLLLTAVLVVLPFHPARAEQSTCDRVQTDIAAGNAADLAAILLAHYPDITSDQVDRSIGYCIAQTPVSTNQCAVTWTVQDLPTAPGGAARGCLVVLGVELGLLGITIYVIYRVYNPPPPDPHKPDWEMYMTTNGMIMEYGGPVMN